MSHARTGSLETLRRLNRLRVIHALRDEGLISRAEIARRTGLSRSTVSSLVSELQADGLVVERSEPGAAHGDQGGRPPILLSFDASAGVAVGIDFDHHHVRVAVSDLSSRILAERELGLDTDHLAHEGLDAAAELVEQVLTEAGVESSRVIGAGMCLPGPIHRPTGVVGSTAILPGWVGVAAADEMRRRLELPILVDNDANLAALAEAAFGAGRDAKDLIYLMISSGIGAGLVLNGRLYRGAEGLAGELGHVLVDADGPVCRCGNRGCLETVAGTDALAELLRRSHGDGLDGRTIVRLAREGDLGVPARDRRRRARDRQGRRDARQRAQPGAADRRRRPRGGRRAAARRRPRVAPALRAPHGRAGGHRRRRLPRRPRRSTRRHRARPLGGRSRSPTASHGRGRGALTPCRRRNNR